ncbi:hypothetical protein LWI29_030996 [Acer saccharum]|uniref:Uncharacterized protein n=1 Tax=Acer saccharum TaxID=4024 RepID=A0AA39S1L5_ACESA|nr:hypothetical protein LWI29_030996 [Acer saccharum]
MSATPPSDVALVVSSKGSGVSGFSSSKSTGKKPFCVFCSKPGQWKQDCLRLQRCNNANSFTAAAVESTFDDIHSRAAAVEDISSSFTAEEVQLIRKVLMNPGNSHLAASALSELSMNLISSSHLCDQGYHVKFSASSCVVHDHRTGKLCGKGHRIGRLYCI